MKRYPLDAKLAFFRLEVSDETNVAGLVHLVERLERAVAEYTSETKVTLTSDGGTFIVVFLTDKQPIDKAGMETLAAEVVRCHAGAGASPEQGNDT
ncbi:hypothetical protein GGQ74_003028 [Desulfobaculum xiamenense]|uniref:Uncharacterized protein n=1 Tax=Desulfobaculum xiamenense TaxID=995050 RepID=A0A846QMJ9_9BACT|nr:hypothetical protein [Desulfobaculum xiamenense]NJB69331.1 hypothetical protein [Desulfobaculum xiamenense]